MNTGPVNAIAEAYYRGLEEGLKRCTTGAEEFDQGYQDAVVSGLADDPRLASEWLQEQLDGATQPVLDELAERVEECRRLHLKLDRVNALGFHELETQDWQIHTVVDFEELLTALRDD